MSGIKVLGRSPAGPLQKSDDRRKQSGVLDDDHHPVPDGGGSGSGGGGGGGGPDDPLRVTIGVWDLGLTGFQAAAWLEEQHHVVVELATYKVVVCALGPGTSLDHAAALVAAFQDLTQYHPETRELQPISSERETNRKSADASPSSSPREELKSHVAATRMLPRDAFFAATRRLPVKDSIGLISAELICPYPPGVPVLFPGEMITAQAMQVIQEALKMGGTVSGASDPSLASFLVIDRDADVC